MKLLNKQGGIVGEAEKITYLADREVWDMGGYFIGDDGYALAATKLSPVEFKLLFTSTERVAIKKSVDENVQDFFSIVEDQRLTHVDLELQSTKNALLYLASIGILTPERAATILLGQVV